MEGKRRASAATAAGEAGNEDAEDVDIKVSPSLRSGWVWLTELEW